MYSESHLSPAAKLTPVIPPHHQKGFNNAHHHQTIIINNPNIVVNYGAGEKEQQQQNQVDMLSIEDSEGKYIRGSVEEGDLLDRKSTAKKYNGNAVNKNQPKQHHHQQFESKKNGTPMNGVKNSTQNRINDTFTVAVSAATTGIDMFNLNKNLKEFSETRQLGFYKHKGAEKNNDSKNTSMRKEDSSSSVLRKKGQTLDLKNNNVVRKQAVPLGQKPMIKTKTHDIKSVHKIYAATNAVMRNEGSGLNDSLNGGGRTGNINRVVLKKNLNNNNNEGSLKMKNNKSSSNANTNNVHKMLNLYDPTKQQPYDSGVQKSRDNKKAHNTHYHLYNKTHRTYSTISNMTNPQIQHPQDVNETNSNSFAQMRSPRPGHSKETTPTLVPLTHPYLQGQSNGNKKEKLSSGLFKTIGAVGNGRDDRKRSTMSSFNNTKDKDMHVLELVTKQQAALQTQYGAKGFIERDNRSNSNSKIVGAVTSRKNIHHDGSVNSIKGAMHYKNHSEEKRLEHLPSNSNQKILPAKNITMKSNTSTQKAQAPFNQQNHPINPQTKFTRRNRFENTHQQWQSPQKLNGSKRQSSIEKLSPNEEDYSQQSYEQDFEDCRGQGYQNDYENEYENYDERVVTEEDMNDEGDGNMKDYVFDREINVLNGHQKSYNGKYFEQENMTAINSQRYVHKNKPSTTPTVKLNPEQKMKQYSYNKTIEKINKTFLKSMDSYLNYFSTPLSIPASQIDLYINSVNEMQMPMGPMLSKGSRNRHCSTEVQGESNSFETFCFDFSFDDSGNGDKKKDKTNAASSRPSGPAFKRKNLYEKA